MLDADADALGARAARLAEGTGGRVVDAVARVGGGALPLLELPGPAVALEPGPGEADELAAALRNGDPPVVGQIRDGLVLLHLRTLAEDEVGAVVDAVRAVRP
jgi:L-seryl-tRNA(Ser) seleniumtransferase